MRSTNRAGAARRLFLTLLLAGTVAMPAAVGAQLIYPHSPAEEKAANQIKEGLDAAKKAHLEAIEKHKTYLEDAANREREAIVRSAIAERDEQIGVAINEGKISAPIVSRLRDLGFTPTVNGSTVEFKQLSELASYAAQIRDRRSNIVRLGEQRAMAIRRFERTGGRGTYCEPTGANGVEVKVTQASTDPNAAFFLEGICKGLNEQESSMQTALANAGPQIRALLGRTDDAAKVGDGEFQEALLAAADYRKQSKNQQAIARATAAHLKELQRVHRCELAEAKGDVLSARVKQAGEDFDAFLKWVENVGTPPSPGTSAPAAAPPEPKAGSDACAAARTIGQSEDLDSTARFTPAQLQAWIGDAKRLGVGSALIAEAKAKVEQFRGDKAQQILNVLAGTATPDANASEEVRAAASLLKLSDALQKFGLARSGKLPDTSGALIEQAGAQMRATSARIDAERLGKLDALAQLRLDAIREEAVLLTEALAASQQGQADRALLRYSDSWAAGRIPSRVLHADARSTAYASWIAREQAVTEMMYAVLEPAAAELQIYGASGFKAAEVAQILATLGIGAVTWAR